MSDLAHSPLGPSSAERWLRCPASVKATEGMPDTDSDYALEGTAAHTLSEWARTEDKPVKNYLGAVINVPLINGSSKAIEVKQEMVDAVEGFVDRVNALEGDQLIEQRIGYEEYVPNGWGTLDAAIMAPDIATIVDLKYGKGVQKYAEKNEQLMLYALGVMIEWDWLYAFRTFRLVVDQPRLDHYDVWDIGHFELLEWATTVLLPGYRATLDPKAAYVPGEVQCKFCKIKATCRARAENVFGSAVGEFDNLDEAITTAPRAPSTLTNLEIAKAMDALPHVKAWCKAIEAYAMKEIQQGHVVGDWKLVEGRSFRSWGLDEDALASAWVQAGLDRKMLYVEELISPPQAEKVAGKKHDIWQTEGLVVKSAGKPALAPGTDKRPALVIDPNTEFSNLNEGDD